MTNSIAELAEADCILISGSNTTEQHPIIAGRILEAVRGGAELLIFDPRRIQLSPYASMHVRHKPGTDVAYINAMMKVIIDEGLYDREFVESRTEGFESLKESVASCTPEWAADICGIDPEEIVRAARVYASAGSASIVYCMGITQHVTGTDNVESLANLAMLTGNVGKPSTGVNPLRGQNNVQGACDMGGLPNVYTGYQKVTDGPCAEKFAEAWGAELPGEPGLTLMEIIDGALEGEIKVIYIMGENSLVSDPNSNQVRRALENTEFLVVQDILMTPTARVADVVLPGACWAEKDGTFTNTERRVQRIRRAVAPPGEALPDWEIICRVAEELGGKGFGFESTEEIFAEIASLTPSYSGMSYRRLGTGGLQWPCRGPEDDGTAFLHQGEFARGKGKFADVEYRPPAELPDEDYPLMMMTGRIAFHYHTGTMTRSSPSLDREVDTAYVEVNPEDAEALGLGTGQPAKLTSRRGEIVLNAKVTDRVCRGQVFVPFHFAESAANVLTNDAVDPVCKTPELKICAVRLEPA